MKKVIPLLLVVILLALWVLPVTTLALEEGASPRFDYISRVSTNVSINKNTGIATCTATCWAPTAASVKLVCRLQQYKNGTWTTIKTWSDTSTHQGSIAQQRAVYSGYTYRTYTSCYAYNAAGTLIETASLYSSQVTY